ncbi:hypothetical protein AB0P40_09670, partial [Streptomyces sp. NPDC079189]
MRPLVSASTLTAAVAAALLLAPSAHATAPGDNGTVKIHDATTGEELRKNEPRGQRRRHGRSRRPRQGIRTRLPVG